MKRLIAQFFAVSIKTWVPMTLFSVNAKEFPNELSTCVCAAAWIIVSTFSVSSTYLCGNANRVMVSVNKLRKGICVTGNEAVGLLDQVGREEVSLDELEVGAIFDLTQILRAAAVVNLVEAHDLTKRCKEGIQTATQRWRSHNTNWCCCAMAVEC